LFLPLTMAPSSSCDYFSEKRRRCHNEYGKLGEDCLKEELEEKRCLSFQYCPLEAKAYYGQPMLQPDQVFPKATCSLWAESFCYLNILDQRVVEKHLQAQQRVNDSAELRKNCRIVAMDLAKCLQVRYPR
jgi:hypothetical protein